MAYDYIIVGGGSAGCVLANRLSADPSIKVLLLEAGGSDWNPLFRMPAGFAKMTKGVASWGWSTVPQKHLNGRVIWYTQAKVIGGGSSINAQLYTRGNAKDYDAWVTDAGAKGWSYREVLPYFIRSEDNQRLVNAYHGYGGPLGVSYPVNPPPISFAFLRAAQEAGIPFNADFNGAAQDGMGHYQLSTRNAERSSTSSAFLKPVQSRANLTVRLNAQTLKIDIEKGRAVGVTVATGSGVETLRADREVILSSGAIGSPRLLQLSGVGPADALKAAGVPVVHDLPGGGKQPAGPPRPLRHLRVHRRSHLRPSRSAASHRLGRRPVPPLQDRPRHFDALRDRRLLVRRQAGALPRHPVPPRSRLGHRGRRRGDEESRRHAQLCVPASALPRHGAACERRSQGRRRSSTPTIGRTLTIANAPSKGCGSPATSCASPR